jgi:hypothetical protein
MAVEIRAQMTFGALVRTAGVAVCCLLLVAGCASSAARGGCGPGQKCAAPPLPPTTVHLRIGGKSASLVAGEATHTFVKRGALTKILVSIDRPTNVNVTNVWLVVQNSSQPAGSAPSGPTEHFTVLIHRVGVVRPAETLSTTWTPTTQFGAHTMSLGIYQDVGDARESWPVATVTV